MSLKDKDVIGSFSHGQTNTAQSADDMLEGSVWRIEILRVNFDDGQIAILENRQVVFDNIELPAFNIHDGHKRLVANVFVDQRLQCQRIDGNCVNVPVAC